MFLLDTNILARHFRTKNLQVVRAVAGGKIILHPLIHLELLAYQYHLRAQAVSTLFVCRPEIMVRHDAVLRILAKHKLHDQGLSAVDIHLLASCNLHGFGIWTLDEGVRRKAAEMGIPVFGQ